MAGSSPAMTKQILAKKPTLARAVGGRFNGAKGALTMALKPKPPRPTVLAVALTAVALTVFVATPARADRCEDIAGQLKNQIDGLKVGITAANVIYLTHPLAKELSLGCASRNFTNELYAKADGRKPKPEFVDFVAGAAALVFTLPKDDLQKGVARCLSQMGIFRGDDVKSRYRRLDMNCSRTKTEISIAISRGRDE
jgi:hypothetical protein